MAFLQAMEAQSSHKKKGYDFTVDFRSILPNLFSRSPNIFSGPQPHGVMCHKRFLSRSMAGCSLAFYTAVLSTWARTSTNKLLPETSPGEIMGKPNNEISRSHSLKIIV